MKKLLWVLEKQFDISLDTATYLEMLENLRKQYDFRLLTGYLHRRVEPKIVRKKIQYYESVKIPVINRLTSYFFQIRAFSLALKSIRPDVVIFTVSNPLLLRHAMSFKKKFGIKLVSDVRTLPVSSGAIYRYISNKLFALNLRYAASMFDGVTYITDEIRRYCISRYNLPLHQSAIWTSGVNPELFQPATVEYDDQALILLYHGAIAKKRGIDNVIKALPLLKDMNVRLDLLGGGDAMNDLKELALSLGVSNKVSFLNSIDYHDVPNWINHGHVGILPLPDWPGWNTSSPLKLFEYLSCGKPVIVTDIPAHRNVLKGEEFAFWIEDTSPKSIAKVIRQVYDQKSRLKSLGQSARSFIMTKYTWQHQANILGQFLEETIRKNGLTN